MIQNKPETLILSFSKLIFVVLTNSEMLDRKEKDSETGRKTGVLTKSCLDAKGAIKLQIVWTS